MTRSTGHTWKRWPARSIPTSTCSGRGRRSCLPDRRLGRRNLPEHRPSPGHPLGQLSGQRRPPHHAPGAGHGTGGRSLPLRGRVHGQGLSPQNQINRIPLLTCADYAYNPSAYDPARSIGQAILHLAETPAQRDRAQTTGGSLPGDAGITRGDRVRPAVQSRSRPVQAADRGSPFPLPGRDGDRLFRGFVVAVGDAFPAVFADARKTVDADVAWMKNGTSGQIQIGVRFFSGGGIDSERMIRLGLCCKFLNEPIAIPDDDGGYVRRQSRPGTASNSHFTVVPDQCPGPDSGDRILPSESDRMLSGEQPDTAPEDAPAIGVCNRISCRTAGKSGTHFWNAAKKPRDSGFGSRFIPINSYC